MKIAISAIRIGERRREDLGDIEGLAQSIEQYGLFHLPVIDNKNRLIAGLRRVRAHEWLGRTEIEVRVFDDLSEAERRDIELEENIRRKDLTPYEHSKNLVQLADSMATRLKDETEAPPDFPLNTHEKSPRGRPPTVDAVANVAAEIGVSQPTLSLAKQHVAAVERYPELQEMTQHEALTTSQDLDRLPEDAREQRRAELRQAATHTRATRPLQTPRATRTASRQRRPKDPDRPWLNAMHGLYVFQERTGDQAKILVLARRWPRQTLQAYGEELRRVQERLTALEQAFERLLSGPDASTEAARQADGREAASPAADEQAITCEAQTPKRAPEVAVIEGEIGEPSTPAGNTVVNDAGEQDLSAAEIEAEGLPCSEPLGLGESPSALSHIRGDDEGEREIGGTPTHDDSQRDHCSAVAADQLPDDVPDAEVEPTEAEGLRQGSASASPPREARPGVKERMTDRRKALITSMRTLRAQGRSWRDIAKEFHAKGVRTLSGKGTWDGKTASRLMRSAEAQASDAGPEEDLRQRRETPERRGRRQLRADGDDRRPDHDTA